MATSCFSFAGDEYRFCSHSREENVTISLLLVREISSVKLDSWTGIQNARKEAEALAAHTAHIGAKALTDNISAVTQSATALIDAVNNLIRTSSGNAIVLIVVGAGFEVAAYYLLIATAQ